MTAAFLAAEAEILGTGRTWRPTNDAQGRLINEVFAVTRDEDSLISEMERVVSWDAGVINKFLSDRGFDIQIEPLPPTQFGFAAAMKLALKWLYPGNEMFIEVEGTSYPAARLDGGVGFSTSPEHDQPIASIMVEGGDTVHLTKFDKDMDTVDLALFAQRIIDSRKFDESFGAVVFPKVDLDVQPDVSWLIGIWTIMASGGGAAIAQALQQCKLRMNHLGAVVEDAFAGACECFCVVEPKPDLFIDGSFLFVLQRPGMKLPVIAAVVRPDSWKDPGELGL